MYRTGLPFLGFCFCGCKYKGHNTGCRKNYACTEKSISEPIAEQYTKQPACPRIFLVICITLATSLSWVDCCKPRKPSGNPHVEVSGSAGASVDPEQIGRDRTRTLTQLTDRSERWNPATTIVLKVTHISHLRSDLSWSLLLRNLGQFGSRITLCVRVAFALKNALARYSLSSFCSARVRASRLQSPMHRGGGQCHLLNEWRRRRSLQTTPPLLTAAATDAATRDFYGQSDFVIIKLGMRMYIILLLMLIVLLLMMMRLSAQASSTAVTAAITLDRANPITAIYMYMHNCFPWVFKYIWTYWIRIVCVGIECLHH